jgi:hypothetical protein
MILHSMSIPDDSAKLPVWLEQRLVAPDFGRFVAELRAHFPSATDSATPRHLFSRWEQVALTEGLGPVPPDVLTELLKHPASLVALQARIVSEGGPYWDDVIDRDDGISRSFERGKRSLERILSKDAPPSKERVIRDASRKTIVRPARDTVPNGVANRSGRKSYKVSAIVSTGVAVCLAVAVGYLVLRGPDEPAVSKSSIAWGWGKPSGLAPDQKNARAYLNKLADNAEEWSQYQPSDAASVGIRIAEFRIGCTRLMHSSYGPLTDDDKAWLLGQCREWAKLLDGHQQALDAGTDPLTVRTAVDETVRAIAASLREKAKQVG